jgi:hypothetical protein
VASGEDGEQLGVLGLDDAGGLEADEVGAVLGETCGEGVEDGRRRRLGLELELLEERPARDEVRHERLVGGGSTRRCSRGQPWDLFHLVRKHKLQF